MKNKVYVGFVKRLWMILIDAVILALLFVLISFIKFDFADNVITATKIYAISYLLIHFIYVTGFYLFFGATPGKLIGKSRLIDLKLNDTPKLGKIILRYLCYLPSCFFFFWGFINLAFDSRKQTWHDKITGTAITKSKEVDVPVFDRPTRKDSRLFMTTSSVIIFSIILLATLVILYFHEEKLNTDITKLLNKTYIDNVSPEKNSFYYISSFNYKYPKGTISYDSYIQDLINLYKQENLNNSKIKKLLESKEVNFSKSNINELFNEIVENHNLNKLDMIRQTIDDLGNDYNILNQRFSKLKSTDYYLTPYQPSKFIHNPFLMDFLLFYRITLLDNIYKFMQIETDSTLKKIKSDHNFIRKSLIQVDSMLTKLVFLVLDDLTLRTYNFILEHNPKPDMCLYEEIKSISYFSSDQKSLKLPLYREFAEDYSMKSHILNSSVKHKSSILLLTLICHINKLFSVSNSDDLDCSLADDADLNDIFQYSFFDFNKYTNEVYKDLSNLINASESNLESLTYYKNSIPTEPEIDDIMNELNYLTFMKSQDYSIYAGYSTRFYANNSFLALLKCKADIYKRGIKPDQVSNFLESYEVDESEVLGNEILFDAERSVIFLNVTREFYIKDIELELYKNKYH